MHSVVVTPEVGGQRLRDLGGLQVVAAQLGIPNLADARAESSAGRDSNYKSNDDLWQSLLQEELRATAAIKLKSFWLSEWLPLRPGLFYTARGRMSRQRARSHVMAGPGIRPRDVRNFEEMFGRSVPAEALSKIGGGFSYVFDPYGKQSLVDGGYGCVRLKSISVGGEEYWFMGATSIPLAHAGLPVGIPRSLYDEAITRIAREGRFRCDLVGRLAEVPRDLDPLYRDLVHIPQLCLMVEEIVPTKKAAEEMFLVSGCITFQMTTPKVMSTFAAFASFDPAERGAISSAAEWLEEIYVGDLFDGIVLTDFDQQVRRFSGAVFGLEHIMNGTVPLREAEDALARMRISAPEQSMVIERVERLNVIHQGDSSSVNIDSAVAAEGGAAAVGGAAAAADGGAAASHGGAARTDAGDPAELPIDEGE
jgi:hypothetical protein